MRKLGIRIFDELVRVPDGTSSTADAYTSDALNEVLGRYDQLALQIVAEDTVTASAPVTLQIRIETSCCGDSQTWAQKSASPTATLDLTRPTSFPFADDGGMPSYALVRVHVVFMCATAASAHVRIFATARDIGAQDLRGVLPAGVYGWLPAPYEPHTPSTQEKWEQFQRCRKTRPNDECLDLYEPPALR